MTAPKERLIELVLLEDISLGCDQLAAILEALGNQAAVDRTTGGALGGLERLARHLAEKLDRLVQP